jgi:8-oxo-dGTP pyrophosphatase MutT (NUDIX family)
MIIIAFVVDANKRLLLLHRMDRDEREPVKWSIEQGESPEQAMRRELREETGLMQSGIISWQEAAALKKIAWHHPSVAAYYLLQTQTQKPRISINHDELGWVDHDDYRWIDFSDRDTYRLHPSYTSDHRAILSSLIFPDLS